VARVSQGGVLLTGQERRVPDGGIAEKDLGFLSDRAAEARSTAVVKGGRTYLLLT
jgi:hypothetical protein